jgi:uncharacterized protein YyaL (SSP411 family)
MWKNGRLFATHKDALAHLNAYLDDYAYLLAALLELLQAEFDPGTLAFAEDIVEVLLEQFEDRGNGGFFFTSHDHERLIHRPKPGFDNATPSGNGMAAFALQRLTFLTGESRYALAAERTLTQFHTMVIAAGTEFHDLPPALAKPAGSRVNAWVCEGVTCLAPIDRLEDLVEQVSKPGKIQ